MIPSGDGMSETTRAIYRRRRVEMRDGAAEESTAPLAWLVALPHHGLGDVGSSLEVSVAHVGPASTEPTSIEPCSSSRQRWKPLFSEAFDDGNASKTPAIKPFGSVRATSQALAAGPLVGFRRPVAEAGIPCRGPGASCRP